MSLKRQTVWSILPLLVQSAAGLVSVPLFYRYLGAERNALLFDVQVFTGAFGFMDLGLGMAVGRYIGVAIGRGDRAAVRGYWATGNAIAIPLLAVMAAGFIGLSVWFGPKWYRVVNPDDVTLLRGAFVAGGFGLFLSYYGQFWNIVSQAHLDFKFISILKTAMSLLQIMPALFIAWLTGNPLLVIIWTALVGLLQLAVFIWHSRMKYQLGFHFQEASWARLREMSAFTGKTFAMLIVNSVFGSVDRLTIGKLAPQIDFTHYFMAGNVAQRLPALSMAAMGPIYFHASHAIGSSRTSLAQIYEEAFALLLNWYGFVAAWIMVWTPLLLKLWLTLAHKPELVTALTPFFPVLCLAFSFSAISVASVAQLGPLNRVGTELVFYIILGVTTILAVFLGWRLGGLVGVAYGLLCSRVVLVCQDIYVARLVGAKGWLGLRAWKSIAAQGLVAGGFALACRTVPRDSLWLLIPAGLHGGLVAAWLLRQPLQKLAGNWFCFLRPQVAASLPQSGGDGEK